MSHALLFLLRGLELKEEDTEVVEELETGVTNGETGVTNGEAAVPSTAEREEGEAKGGSGEDEDDIEELYDMEHYDSDDGEGGCGMGKIII